MTDPPDTAQQLDGQDLYCRQCRYPLRGLDSRRCPECGQAFDPADPKTYFISPRASRQAVVALVLGLLGLLTVGFFGVGLVLLIAALILAKRALNQIDREDGAIPGRGIARGAAIISWIGVGMVPIVVAFVMMSSVRPFPPSGKNHYGAQIRSTVISLVLWSSSETTTDDFPKVGVPAYKYPDNSTVNRYNALCNATNDPLSPKLLAAPKSGDVIYTGLLPVSLRTTNISYALLDAASPDWKNLDNAGTPLVCDKQVGQGSMWNTTNWQGYVGWGDCHTTFETSRTVTTEIKGIINPADDLFRGNPATDAVMVNP
jgi:hypothetical protein